jgi:hypothetical protein
MAVQRSHDTDAGERRRPSQFRDQHRALDSSFECLFAITRRACARSEVAILSSDKWGRG